MPHPIRMTKEELGQALSDFGVTFPPTATIQQLRTLYAEHSRGAKVNENESDSELNDNNNKNSDVKDDSAKFSMENENRDANLDSKMNQNSNEFRHTQHNEQIGAQNSHLYDEEAAIDMEIRLLEKRKKLAELRRELNSESTVMTAKN